MSRPARFAPWTGALAALLLIAGRAQAETNPRVRVTTNLGEFVIEGMDVLDRISVVATGAVGPFKSDAPLKAVVIEKAEILDASAQVSTEKQSLSSPSTPVQSPR